jgi:hypothetical protein
VKGKRVDFKVKENPFLREKISLGRPDIKPERATMMPVVKEIPQTKRPPELIREIKVRELKEKRPMVREKEASVLKPESRPKGMQLKIKEGKPVEREIEKIREREPTGKGADKSREIRPSEKKVQKPEFEAPREGEKMEKGSPGKPNETKAPERGVVEKSKEYKPPEKGSQRLRESRPLEKGVEKPGTIEKGTERSKEIKPSERGMEKIEKEVEKPRPVEKGTEKPRDVQEKREQMPERKIEK